MSDEHNINENPGLPEKKKPGEEGFGLPEGYFDSFTSRLFNRMDADNELAEFKLLSSVPKQNAFAVPENYFEAVSVRTEIKAELSSYERLATYRNVYEAVAPDNYFESFAERLQHRIELAEEIRAFAALSAIDKENCFVADEAYFESLAGKVKERIHSPQPAGMIDWLQSIFFTRKLVYAFGLLLIVAVAVVYQNKKETETDPATDCGTIACLDKKEIMNSTYLKNLDEESLIELIDVNAFSDSLNKKSDKETDKEALDYVIENADANTIIDEL